MVELLDSSIGLDKNIHFDHYFDWFDLVDNIDNYWEYYWVVVVVVDGPADCNIEESFGMESDY